MTCCDTAAKLKLLINRHKSIPQIARRTSNCVLIDSVCTTTGFLGKLSTSATRRLRSRLNIDQAPTANPLGKQHWHTRKAPKNANQQPLHMPRTHAMRFHDTGSRSTQLSAQPNRPCIALGLGIVRSEKHGLRTGAAVLLSRLAARLTAGVLKHARNMCKRICLEGGRKRAPQQA